MATYDDTPLMFRQDAYAALLREQSYATIAYADTLISLRHLRRIAIRAAITSTLFYRDTAAAATLPPPADIATHTH